MPDAVEHVLQNSLAEFGKEREATIAQAVTELSREREAAIVQLLEAISTERQAALEQVLVGIKTERSQMIGLVLALAAWTDLQAKARFATPPGAENNQPVTQTARSGSSLPTNDPGRTSTRCCFSFHNVRRH